VKAQVGRRASFLDIAFRFAPLSCTGLALSGANAAPDHLGRTAGVITAEEIAALDLSGCDLAVVSACDTARGLSTPGQGVASLQRGFLLAGARSVLSALWPIGDVATSVFMDEYYYGLWNVKLTKSAALSRAKRVLREAKDEKGGARFGYADWAGFVLMGEPD
jgi:CHAT domain-containing protein